MNLPDTGFTVAMLATQAGLVAAVLLITQAFKWFQPTVKQVRICALLVGVTTALVVQGFVGTAEPALYAVAAFNGVLAAVMAMKGQETVKHGLAGEVWTLPPVKTSRK